MLWIPAYIALGSNLNEPRRQIATAFERLASLPHTRLIARSHLYLSAPMGPQDQPEFVNAAAGVLTQLDPDALLVELKTIQNAMGKTAPPVRWGPRIIDLDLLLHGSTRTMSPELTLPHAGVHQRNFVLQPLAEIAPTLEIPGHGQVQVLARRAGMQGLTPLQHIS